ncbi:hypothetical protein J8M20_06285 [Pseudoalteromonas luteoviolacea]|uniref:hypothetical protein n=1 Tax=Pseudoalteromonas luteoviolacea TaxID=43657 RepID=UPI001B376D1A|nr:hypothetical protein [Pseudoalteromonas luteoviolacea]MBQ4810935.1 hypothetical protein [Pseudoalteromonas luteoviolacea]
MKYSNKVVLSSAAILVGVLSSNAMAQQQVYSDRTKKSDYKIGGSSKVYGNIKVTQGYRDWCDKDSVGCKSRSYTANRNASLDIRLWKARLRDLAQANIDQTHKAVIQTDLVSGNKLFIGYKLQQSQIDANLKNHDGKVIWRNDWSHGENQKVGVNFHLSELNGMFSEMARYTSRAKQCFRDQVQVSHKKAMKGEHSWFGMFKSRSTRSIKRLILDNAISGTINTCAPSLRSRIAYYQGGLSDEFAHDSIQPGLRWSKRFEKDYFEQWQHDTTVDTKWGDVTADFKLKANYGYKAALSLDALVWKQQMYANFDPYVKTWFDVNGSFGSIDLEGKADPLIEAKLDVGIGYDASEHEVWAEASLRYHTPSGKVEGCYGFLCADLWEERGSWKHKKLYETDWYW